MYLLFADSAVSAADSQIFHRPAETTHSVPFKMRQHQHRIIINDIFTHGNFLEMPAAAYRQQHCTLCIHDIHRAERPAVDTQGFNVISGRISIAMIKSIRFY